MNPLLVRSIRAWAHSSPVRIHLLSRVSLSKILQLQCPRGFSVVSHALWHTGNGRLARPPGYGFQRRWLQYSLPSLQSPPSPSTATPATAGHAVPTPAARQPPTPANDAVPTQAQQRRIDFNILKDLLINVWPKHGRETKIRVVVALSLLIAGKVSPCEGPLGIIAQFNPAAPECTSSIPVQEHC